MGGVLAHVDQQVRSRDTEIGQEGRFSTGCSVPMSASNLLGLAAGTLTTVAFLPQVIRVWRTRSARDLSYAWIVTFAAGVVLWLVYGVSVRSTPVVLANVATLLLVLVLLGLKLRFERGGGHARRGR